MIKTERAGSSNNATRYFMRIAGTLMLLVALAACNGGKGGAQDRPQDVNRSLRSPAAYDPAVRELEPDPVVPKKQQQ